MTQTRQSKRKQKDGKLTTEDLNKLDTEALCNYIENKGKQE